MLTLDITFIFLLDCTFVLSRYSVKNNTWNLCSRKAGLLSTQSAVLYISSGVLFVIGTASSHAEFLSWFFIYQGVEFAVFIHESRALTEGKEYSTEAQVCGSKTEQLDGESDSS
jgi:hypothetical protein